MLNSVYDDLINYKTISEFMNSSEYILLGENIEVLCFVRDIFQMDYFTLLVVVESKPMVFRLMSCMKSIAI